MPLPTTTMSADAGRSGVERKLISFSDGSRCQYDLVDSGHGRPAWPSTTSRIVILGKYRNYLARAHRSLNLGGIINWKLRSEEVELTGYHVQTKSDDNKTMAGLLTRVYSFSTKA